MFSELNRSHILTAINSAIENPIREGSEYSVSYFNQKYSSKELIRRAYQLSEMTIPNIKFDTNQAQDRLLELGFPIVENSKSNAWDFFSHKDLISFDRLVGRESYNSTSTVDNNIGSYLNTISWGKSKIWAERVKGDKFEVDGKRSWNKTHRKHGQVYQKYTWFKLVPKNSVNKKVYFTVGIDWHTSLRLIYKLDIQRNDSYFDEARQKYFDQKLIALSIHRHFVDAHQLHSYDWVKLIEECERFLNDNLENYYAIVEELKHVKPIKAARICWNTNGWVLPSGRNGKSIYGSFESDAGFANDEWIFDLNANDGKYCYARLEPISKSRKKLLGKSIDLLLFTFERDSESMEWIGKISNAKIISEKDSSTIHESEFGLSLFQNRQSQLLDIKDIKISFYENMPSGDMYNLRFRPQDVEIFDTSSPVDNDVINFKRYILHDISNDQFLKITTHDDNFEPQTFDDADSNGLSLNIPSTPKKIKKNYNASTKEYDNLHREIQIGIITYLNNTYPNSYITYENSKEINNRSIDIVMLLNKTKIYIEIKSYPSLRTCIRQAIGQLIEYSYFVDSKRADKLIISSQHPVTKNVDDFLAHLRLTLGLNIYYSQFDSESYKLVNLDSILI